MPFSRYDLESMLDCSSEIFFVKDANHAFVMVNAAACTFFGRPREQVLGKTELDLFPKDQVDVFWRQDDHVLATGEESNNVEHIADGLGRLRTFFTHKNRHVDADGQPFVVGTCRDVTDQYQAEVDLRESEHRYRQLFEAESDAIVLIDNETGRILAANGATSVLYGYSPGELVTLLNSDLSAEPKDTQTVTQNMPLDVENVVTIPLRYHRKKDGTLFPVEITGRFFIENGRPVHIAAIRDISGRLKTEAALRASEEEYRELVENANSIILRLDVSGKITFANAFAEQFFGYAEHMLTGREVVGAIVPANTPSAAALEEMIRDIARAPDRYASSLMEHMRADGERVWVAWTNKPILDQQQATKNILCVGNDFTVIKRAQEAARATGQRLALLVEQSPLAFIEFDKDFRVTTWNPAAETIFGYTAREAVGSRAIDLIILPEKIMSLTAVFTALLEQNGATHGINENRTSDGRTILCEWYNTPLFDAQGFAVGVASLAVDITGRRRLEEQLQQAQKMEAVGQLAGGVAHDFNNLLQVINGSVDLLLEDHLPGDDDYPLLKEIGQAGERAAKVVSQLLIFSRRQEIHPVLLDLNEVVAGLLSMLVRLIGEHIQIKFQPGQGNLPIFADRSQMEQVLLNLSVNARDAMPEAGHLRISTRCCAIDPAFCARNTWARPGNYALLCVEDTGIGMDRDTLGHIFDPFYTTKEVGKGTGLGLAMVYGIVDQHRGFIHVASEPGKGASFSIYLPITKAVETTEHSQENRPVAGGSETILFAEDDELVRNLTRRILERAGYDVLVAANGREAIQLAENAGGRIGLALLDVVMPELGGRAVYEYLRERYLDIRFLFASGYSAQSMDAGFWDRQGLTLIQKPYEPKMLLTAIRKLLDG